MRAREKLTINGLALGMLAGSVGFGAAGEVHAASALCPSVVVPPNGAQPRP